MAPKEKRAEQRGKREGGAQAMHVWAGRRMLSERCAAAKPDTAPNSKNAFILLKSWRRLVRCCFRASPAGTKSKWGRQLCPAAITAAARSRQPSRTSMCACLGSPQERHTHSIVACARAGPHGSSLQRRRGSTHLDIHAGGQVQGHQLVHCLGGQVLDVNQPLVQAHLQGRAGRGGGFR